MLPKKKFFIIRIVVLIIFLYILFYLLYGKKNIFVYFSLKKDIKTMHHKLDLLQMKAIALNKKLESLSSTIIDADLIEEIAKKEFFFVKKNELTITNDNYVKY